MRMIWLICPSTTWASCFSLAGGVAHLSVAILLPGSAGSKVFPLQSWPVRAQNTKMWHPNFLRLNVHHACTNIEHIGESVDPWNIIGLSHEATEWNNRIKAPELTCEALLICQWQQCLLLLLESAEAFLQRSLQAFIPNGNVKRLWSNDLKHCLRIQNKCSLSQWPYDPPRSSPIAPVGPQGIETLITS